MAFQFEGKKPGDIIKSSDWNTLNTEVVRLGTDKVDRAGDTIKGDLTVTGKVNVSGPLSITSTSTLTGNTSVGGTLTVTGASTLTGNTSVGGTLSVTGGSAFGGDMSLGANLKLAANKELLFVDNGQIRSGDNNHRILFRRSENKLELREFGQIIFSSGATTGAETAKMVLLDNGNVGVGATTPGERLEANGRIKAGNGTIGPWPANANYTFFGTNTLDQSAAGNYALLQETTPAGKGITFLNSPENIRFRIANADMMILDKNGNVGVGTATPAAKLEVNGTAKAREFLTTLYTDGNKGAFALSSANQWADVADLTRTFSLPQETAVLVYYQITTVGGQHLVTRLIVDGVDIVFGRSIVGNTTYWSPSSLWIGRLAAGSHTIKVQYRTATAGTSNPSADDWQNRVLHVLVFGS